MNTPDDPFAPPSDQPGVGAPAGDYGASPPGYGPPPTPFGAPPLGYDPAGGYGTPPAGYGTPPSSYGSPGYPQQPWAGPAQTSTKAVVALVLAICSYVVLPLLPSIAALVLASSARRDILAAGGQLTGGGLVKAARILAWINIGFCLLVLVMLVLGLVLLSSSSRTVG